jgi:hypothetical protein
MCSCVEVAGHNFFLPVGSASILLSSGLGNCLGFWLLIGNYRDSRVHFLQGGGFQVDSG